MVKQAWVRGDNDLIGPQQGKVVRISLNIQSALSGLRFKLVTAFHFQIHHVSTFLIISIISNHPPQTPTPTPASTPTTFQILFLLSITTRTSYHQKSRYFNEISHCVCVLFLSQVISSTILILFAHLLPFFFSFLFSLFTFRFPLFPVPLSASFLLFFYSPPPPNVISRALLFLPRLQQLITTTTTFRLLNIPQPKKNT